MSTKRITKLIALCIATLMCASALTACAFGNSPKAKYRKALELTDQGDYEAAYALFTELGDYEDAAEEAARFRYLPTGETAEFVTAEGTKIESLVISFDENNLPTQCIKTGENGYQHTCLFSYTTDGKLLKINCSDTDGLTEYVEYLYNENGNLIKESHLHEDGTTSTYDYTYYEENDLVKMASVSDPYGSYSYEYFYDEEGKETKVIGIIASAITTYEYIYDANGNLIKMIGMDENGNEVMLDEYTYNEKGLCLVNNYSTGELYTLRIEYAYDDKDQVIRESYITNDTDDETYEYTYDDNGNVIKMHIKRSDNTKDNFTTEYKLVYVPFAYTEIEWNRIAYSLTGW